MDYSLWTPVRTKPRREKKLARFCRAKGVAVYLPLINKLHTYGKRKAEFSSPMLPGYVFCRINEESYQKILPSNAVVYKIDIDAYSEKELKNDLKALRAFERLSNTHQLEVKPELVAGTPVEIASGSFQGTNGVVMSRKNHSFLIVNIKLLGYSVRAEINAEDLDVVDEMDIKSGLPTSE